jgi:hypothetical protein
MVWLARKDEVWFARARETLVITTFHRQQLVVVIVIVANINVSFFPWNVHPQLRKV